MSENGHIKNMKIQEMKKTIKMEIIENSGNGHFYRIWGMCNSQKHFRSIS